MFPIPTGQKDLEEEENPTGSSTCEWVIMIRRWWRNCRLSAFPVKTADYTMLIKFFSSRRPAAPLFSG